MARGFSIVGYPSNYKTPSAIGTQYNLLDVYIEPYAFLFLATADVTITHSDGTTQTFETQRTSSITGATLSFSSNTFEIKEGENKIEYVVTISTGNSGQEYAKTTSTFTIYGVTNRYPLKPWTVNDVMQRILQLVEPIRRNQPQRFTFTPPTGENAKLFSQFAPEFTFTRLTLREALQTVGGFIHGEPRLNEDNSITFDYYGEQEYAEYTNYKTGRVKRLNEYKYRTLQSKYGIEQATTKLDSYQDNLVNRIAWEEGTTGQPYKSGIQTLRTETAYIRGTEEDTFFFPTVQGIDRIVKFEYIHEGTGYDITPYVFEENVYNNLSSYDENYPVSKSYALYFTQGGKGIKGFFYKVPSEFGGNVGKTYSIVNIIKAASGINQSANYQDMQFRLTYVPIYSTRVQQSKAYINDYLPLPRILNYTQSDNSVEARYFGENIKGAISRMGNVEKTYTLNLRNFNNIPKAGLLWEDDYYIASVSVSVNADLFEVSVGLSKNFNRKSQYIGASSYKRIYEVSETMVQQRHTVYTDYIVISDTAVNDYENTALLLQDKGFQTITSIFNAPDEGENNGIVAVHAFGQSKGNANANGDLQENVMLPVIASAFGNAMEFTWEYKDNFSAGLKNETLTQGQVTGTFGKEVEYTDYYGRLYFYYFSLLSESQVAQYTGIYPDKLPQVFVDTQFPGMAGITYPIAPMIERKDSREALRKTYTVEFVTDNKDIVIGSAFAGKNPLVYNDAKRRQPHLYVLPKRVNKFATSVDLTSIEYAKDMGVVSLQYSARGKYYFSNGVHATKAGQAWVIAFEPYWELGNPVETEDGTVETPVIWYGGEIILAKNKPILEGDTVGDFYAYAVHDVYDFIKAKN